MPNIVTILSEVMKEGESLKKDKVEYEPKTPTVSTPPQASVENLKKYDLKVGINPRFKLNKKQKTIDTV